MSTPEVFKKADDIAKYLTEVLKSITVANGYPLELPRVYRGRLKHDEDRVPYGVLIEGEDRVGGDPASMKDVAITQDFVLGAYVECDPNNPNDAAHVAIRAIKKAVFTSDLARKQQAGARGGNGRVKSLTYKGKDIGPRPDGKAIVYAVVYIEVTFAEDLLDA